MTTMVQKRSVFLLLALALAASATADEKPWSQVAGEWLDHYDLAIGRTTRDDYTSALVKRGAICKPQGASMVACAKKGEITSERASFGSDGRAHYFSLSLTSDEAPKPCTEIAEHLKTKYGSPSYGIQGGGVGYNFPKKRRHIEFGPTRGVPGCILSVQLGVRSK